MHAVVQHDCQLARVIDSDLIARDQRLIDSSLVAAELKAPPVMPMSAGTLNPMSLPSTLCTVTFTAGQVDMSPHLMIVEQTADDEILKLEANSVSADISDE